MLLGLKCSKFGLNTYKLFLNPNSVLFIFHHIYESKGISIFSYCNILVLALCQSAAKGIFSTCTVKQTGIASQHKRRMEPSFLFSTKLLVKAVLSVYVNI